MPENSDFSLLADMGAPGERDLPESATTPQFGDELRNALEPAMREPLQKFRDLQSHIVVMNKAAEVPAGPTKQTVKTDPKTGQRTWSGEMPAEAAEAYFRNSQAYQQMLGGYAQQMGQIEQQLRMQEQAIRNQPPWVQLATALAGNMAQAKDMPGWVQGLGRTAAQLNPRPEEIQAKRMAVLGSEAELAEKAIGLDIAQQRVMADTKQAELARKTIADADKRAADFLNKARLAVRGGSGTPLSFDAFSSGAMASGVAPERIPGLYQTHLEEAKLAAEGKEADVTRKQKLMTFGEDLKEKLQGIKQRDRMAQIQKSFENSISASKEGFQLKLYEQKKAIDETAAGRKETAVLGPVAMKSLTQASATNQYIGTVEHMLEQPEWAEVQGPLFQFNPKTNEFKLNPQAVLPKQFKNIDRTVVESQIAHEIPRLLTILLNSQAGGASILRIEAGQKLIRDMGITGAVRPDQALAIMKIVRDTNNNNITATMRAKQNANWPAMRDLVGADDPRNAYYFKGKKDAFGGPIQPFPSLERREGPTAGPQKDYGPAPPGLPDGTTGNKGKFVVKNGRWVNAS